MSHKWLNKGVIAGVATVLAGVLSIFTATGHTPPEILVSVLAVLGGVVTTKDSVDTRK